MTRGRRPAPSPRGIRGRCRVYSPPWTNVPASPADSPLGSAVFSARGLSAGSAKSYASAWSRPSTASIPAALLSTYTRMTTPRCSDACTGSSPPNWTSLPSPKRAAGGGVPAHTVPCGSIGVLAGSAESLWSRPIRPRWRQVAAATRLSSISRPERPRSGSGSRRTSRPSLSLKTDRGSLWIFISYSSVPREPLPPSTEARPRP
jgi:hypothetical protein